MRRTYDAVMTVIFTAFIFAVLALFLVLPKAEFSYNEKRNLSEKPELSVKNVFNGRFERDTEDYITDHFPFRDSFVALSSYFDLYTGRNGINGVYKCKDGYLINTPVEDEYFDANIRTICEFANKTDADISVLIVPTAGSILTDKLPKNRMTYPDDGLIDGAYTKAEDCGMGVLDIRKTFEKSDKEIYYKTDHHWTSYGAYLAYTELVNDAYDISDFEIKSYDGFYGTTYSKSALWREKSDSIEIFDYTKNVSVKIYDGDSPEEYTDIFFYDYMDKPDKYPVFLDGNHAYTRVINHDIPTGRLLIVKDSYANSLAPFLIRHYNTVDMVDLRYYTDRVSELLDKEDYDKILFVYGLSTVAETTDINMLD